MVMMEMATSFVIIPQMHKDHNAFHIFEWPRTVRQIYLWIGHEELRDDNISANEWMDNFNAVVAQIKQNLPNLKTIKQMFPMPNWRSTENAKPHNKAQRMKYNDIIRRLRQIAASQEEFNFVETSRLGYNLPAVWLQTRDRIDHNVIIFIHIFCKFKIFLRQHISQSFQFKNN